MRWLIALVLLWAWPAGATNYWADSNAGGLGDGSSEANAFPTLDGNIEGMTSGDTCFVRERHEESLSSDIALAGDGTASLPVVIWGDGPGTGPNRYWAHDTGDSTATITCNGYQLQAQTDDNWHVHGIVFDTITEYAIAVNISGLFQITRCSFTGMAASSDYGIYVGNNVGNVDVQECTFNGGGQGVGLYVASGVARVSGSSFDHCTNGAEVVNGRIDLANCSFGQSTANVSADVKLNGYATGYARILGGALTNNTGLVDGNTGGFTAPSAFISRYYRDGSQRPMVFVNSQNWEMLSSYSVLHSGGAGYSLGYTTPIAAEPGVYKKVAVWSTAVNADSAETRTYSLFAYRDANWGSDPGADGLYLECQYQYGDSIRSERSTQTLSSSETWTELSIADVSPQHKGPVILTLWLGAYDADGVIYVDPKPTGTGEAWEPTNYYGIPDLAGLYSAPTSGNPRVIIVN